MFRIRHQSPTYKFHLKSVEVDVFEAELLVELRVLGDCGDSRGLAAMLGIWCHV